MYWIGYRWKRVQRPSHIPAVLYFMISVHIRLCNWNEYLSHVYRMHAVLEADHDLGLRPDRFPFFYQQTNPRLAHTVQYLALPHWQSTSSIKFPSASAAQIDGKSMNARTCPFALQHRIYAGTHTSHTLCQLSKKRISQSYYSHFLWKLRASVMQRW